MIEAVPSVVVAAIIVAVATLWMSLKRRWPWLVVTLVLVLITPLMIPGFWWSTGELGISDWDYYFSYHEVIRNMVLTYGEIPQWNPYICGGTSAIGDPEFPLFTVTFLIELFTGIPIGLRLAIYIATAVGAIGMAWLLRKIGSSPVAGLTAGIIYGFGSVNLLEIVEGHQNIFAAMWIPWVLLAWLSAYHALPAKFGRHSFFSWRVAVLGLLLAAMFYAGGIYLLMYLALAFLFFIVSARRKIAALTVTGLAGGWALGLAAMKLIPVLLWLTQFQDAAYASSASTLAHLNEILLGRHLHGAEVIPNQGGGWHEYGAYVGPLTIVLALGSLLMIKRRLVQILIIAFTLALFVSATGPVLKPFFDQASFLPRSNISRFILLAIIPLSIMAGLGSDTLRRTVICNTLKKRLYLAIGLAIITAGLTFDLGTLSSQLSYQAFILGRDTAEPIKAAVSPIQYTIGDEKIRHEGIDHTRAYLLIEKGWGTQSYCTVLSPQVAVKTVQHREENSALLQISDPAGEINLQSWRPNEVLATVTAATKSEVVLNANYASGWLVNEKPAKEVSNRVATQIEPGQHVLAFHYEAPGFRLGQGVSTVFVLLFGGVLWRSTRRTAARPQSARVQDTDDPPQK